MKVVIECQKNILENGLKKDFQISRFKLTDGTFEVIQKCIELINTQR